MFPHETIFPLFTQEFVLLETYVIVPLKLARESCRKYCCLEQTRCVSRCLRKQNAVYFLENVTLISQGVLLQRGESN